jgi:calcium-dependent protein kinase
MADIIEVEKIGDIFTGERKLGEGCFGQIYLCRENATGAKYALKCIDLEHDNLENVQHEAGIMDHLAGHTNIMAIEGILKDDRYAYMVMEFCNGGDLHSLITEQGYFQEEVARRLIGTIISTVDIIHALGIIHRDLKPENFLVQVVEDEVVLKCADFGLSSFFSSGQVFTEIVGSPTSMAPEVLEGHYGPEADMWSVGVILYVLLCGAWPFYAQTNKEAKRILQRRKPPSFKNDIWLHISDGAKDLVL